MLVFFALERRSSWFILLFAFGCAPASAYGSCREPGLSDLQKAYGASYCVGRYGAADWISRLVACCLVVTGLLAVGGALS